MPLIADLDILNAACVRVGLSALGNDGLDEESDEARTLELTYEAIVEFNLGIYLFSFAKEIRQLSLNDGAAPKSGYTYAFDIPAEAIGDPIYVTDDITNPRRRFDAYAIVGRQVESSSSPLYAQIRIRPEPIRWSPAFKQATITAIGAQLALSMREDRALHDTLQQLAYGAPSDEFRGGQLGLAMRVDGFSTPPRKPNWQNNPLERAWRGETTGSEE